MKSVTLLIAVATFSPYAIALAQDAGVEGKEKGLWRLRAKASEWSLILRGNEIVNSKDNLIQIKQNISLIDENRIITFEIDWPKLGLEITFNNEMKLKINPVWDDDYELAHWEFLMPNTMFLQVGPKSTWSYYPSNMSIT